MQMLTPEGHYQLSPAELKRTHGLHAAQPPPERTPMPQSHDHHVAGKWNTGQLNVQINVQKGVLHLLSTELIIWTENTTMIHDATQAHTKLHGAVSLCGTTSGD